MDMFIVQNGTVEILTEIDGQELVIERLHRGSVINHRSFLFNDVIDSSARCETPASILYMNQRRLQEIRNKSQALDQECSLIEHEMLERDDNAIAIDYIIVDEKSERRHSAVK